MLLRGGGKLGARRPRFGTSGLIYMRLFAGLSVFKLHESTLLCISQRERGINVPGCSALTLPQAANVIMKATPRCCLLCGLVSARWQC